MVFSVISYCVSRFDICHVILGAALTDDENEDIDESLHDESLS